MSIYEEVEIEDMIYNDVDYSYTYQCPCGDIFRITLEELHDGEDIAKCPSCTLRIMVVYDISDLPPLPNDNDDDDEGENDDEESNDKGNPVNKNVDISIIDHIGSIKVS